MKRLRNLLLLCCFIMSLLGACLPAAADGQTLRVGISSGENPNMVVHDEAHIGLIKDALREVSKYTNWRYEYVEGTEDELLALLAEGQIDLLPGLFYRDGLLEMALYPQYVTGYSYALLVSGAEDDSIQKDDFNSMQGKRIAAVVNQSETQRLTGYLALNNIKSTIVYTESLSDSMDRLRNGVVDMALLGGDSADGYRTITRFVVEPYYIGVSPQRPDLVRVLNDAYALILDTDPDFVDHLYARYFAQPTDSELQLTRAERAYVQRRPALKVLILDGFAPLQYYNDDGQPSGISVEILEIIRESTGLEMEFVRSHSVPAALEAVQSGEADAILGLPFSDETAADYDLIMSRAYTDAYRVAVTRQHTEFPSANMTLAQIRGLEFLIDEYASDIVYADTFMGCVELVNSGAADYTYGSSYFVEYGTQGGVFRNIQTYTIPGVTDPIGIALKRPAESLLLTTLNKAISSIPTNTIQDIVLRNASLQVKEQTLQSFIYAYPMLVIAALGTLTGLIIIVTAIITLLRARHSRALYKTQFTDELTGALNLTGFRREASRLLQGSSHYALSYTTIRNFHFINDRYGYEVGDDVLRRIASVYRADMQENEVFCRVSGGTFVCLWMYGQQQAFFSRAERLFEELHRITPRTDPGYHVRTITGVYLSEEPVHSDVLSMMDRANAARQQIITSSELSCSVYQEGSYDNLIYMQEIESRMEPALQNGDFRVYMQPKYDLSTMMPGGAEALVRWLDDGKIIPPDDFIPQFERNGFIARLDRYMFEQVCSILRRWLDTGMPTVPVSVNVSRVQLYSPTFVADYVAIRDEYQIPEGLLELEFTESILFEDVDRLIKIVQDLHDNGFGCSIDDFGKGYSSLTMLKNIPADVIKLDALFFDTGIDGQRDTIIIESVVDIAKSLGMTSIAEGIEDKQQVKLLQMIGCDMAQGYVFSRPLDMPTFERYLHQKIIERKDPYAPLDD